MKSQFLYIFKECLNPGQLFNTIMTPNWKMSSSLINPVCLIQTKPSLVCKHVKRHSLGKGKDRKMYLDKLT